MTQVGRLIMLKTVPFYSIIRSFELRDDYARMISVYYVPKGKDQLNVETAKWFLKNGPKQVKPSQHLTNLIRCCKEYISIANQ